MIPDGPVHPMPLVVRAPQLVAIEVVRISNAGVESVLPFAPQQYLKALPSALAQADAVRQQDRNSSSETMASGLKP
eukprot:CAMPEP_0180654266 /NCGR_PEP_ID=MMETSP1037_2-20121125/54581_1 /TAXON_ID=632150 /ORGANISM="Azadinium spinosum, Strain 3D9" /LENGTH=75 /DNA_ID=CAMNT_0022680479 /DNA_START=65 /DNA_END=289 /DNA_ORIENTATION=+